VAPKVKNASASQAALNQGWLAFSQQVEIQWLVGKLFRQVGKIRLPYSSGFCGWFSAVQGKRQLGQVRPRS